VEVLEKNRKKEFRRESDTHWRHPLLITVNRKEWTQNTAKSIEGLWENRIHGSMFHSFYYTIDSPKSKISFQNDGF
jgi:hypothetical protein